MNIEDKYLYFVENYNCTLNIVYGLSNFNFYLNYKNTYFDISKVSNEEILRVICKKLKLNYKYELTQYNTYLLELKNG